MVFGGRDQDSQISWIVIAYNIYFHSLCGNSTLSIVCIILFVVSVSVINKVTFYY